MVKRKGFGLREENLAQKRAIESVSNVANVFGGSPVGGAKSALDTDEELAEIVSVLSDAGTALAIAEVAKRLQWSSEKAANALARGGEIGLLKFYRDEDLITVALNND